MDTFRSTVFSSVVAGFVVSVILTVIQQFGTMPLILRAEIFEQATEAHRDTTGAGGAHEAAADHNHAEYERAESAWETRDGLERNACTAVANVPTAIGFALLSTGSFALRSDTTSETYRGMKA
jgi:predicted cobalt transporter CbtA